MLGLKTYLTVHKGQHLCKYTNSCLLLAVSVSISCSTYPWGGSIEWFKVHLASIKTLGSSSRSAFYLLHALRSVLRCWSLCLSSSDGNMNSVKTGNSVPFTFVSPGTNCISVIVDQIFVLNEWVNEFLSPRQRGFSQGPASLWSLFYYLSQQCEIASNIRLLFPFLTLQISSQCFAIFQPLFNETLAKGEIEVIKKSPQDIFLNCLSFEWLIF